jgi:hypothetical protein
MSWTVSHSSESGRVGDESGRETLPVTEGVTGHQGDSARARFVAELTALRGRSAVTADDISD